MKIPSTPPVAGSTMQPPLKSAATESVKPSVTAAQPHVYSGPVTQAQQMLRDMPEVDLQRVAELKAALGRGELELDAESLSRSMMDYYRR